MFMLGLDVEESLQKKDECCCSCYFKRPRWLFNNDIFNIYIKWYLSLFPISYNDLLNLELQLCCLIDVHLFLLRCILDICLFCKIKTYLIIVKLSLEVKRGLREREEGEREKERKKQNFSIICISLFCIPYDALVRLE